MEGMTGVSFVRRRGREKEEGKKEELLLLVVLELTDHLGLFNLTI